MKKKGFTLIELLVVVAIIGLLSSIVLASLNSARIRARDAKRLSDIHQIQIALELYFDDNSEYPRYDTGSPTCNNSWALSHPTYINCWNDLRTKLDPYLPALSQDPLGTYPPTYSYSTYHYRTRKSGQGYYLLMDPELLDPDNDDGCYPGIWYCKGVNW